MASAEPSGLTKHTVMRSWLDSGVLGADRGFERYPLLRGHKTGSRDGTPLAPLLGSIKAFDGGATDVHLGPVTFGLFYCDHVVIYRFTPRGMRSTDCEITWLVNETAVEGKDYDVAELTWLWDVTTKADKQIIERNQAGVDSRFYRARSAVDDGELPAAVPGVVRRDDARIRWRIAGPATYGYYRLT